MSLYVRVMNNFYTHRKTLRLRAALGDAAFWVPPRLWAYAAENQPDGCFKDYSAEELASLISYSSNASRMLEALLQAGFLDENPLRIHSWEEHNSYHSTFAARAKTAATARWSKSPTPPERTVQERKGKETSIASSIDASRDPILNPGEVLDAWNEKADNYKLPKCMVMSDKRRRYTTARLRDPFFSQNWKAALERMTSSTFCKGANDRGWVADFDFFIQPDSVAKIMEGKYDERKPTTNGVRHQEDFTSGGFQ